MADINLGVVGPIQAALQTLATLTMGIIASLDKQLEIAPDPIKTELLQQRLKHEKRLNWVLDKLFGIFGYVDDSTK